MSKPKLTLSKSLPFIFAILLGMMLIGTAWSAGQQTQQQGMGEEQRTTRPATFSELDQNQDGYVSKKEAENWEKLSSKFKQIDENNDQKLDRSEFSAFETKEIEKSMNPEGQDQSPD